MSIFWWRLRGADRPGSSAAVSAAVPDYVTLSATDLDLHNFVFERPTFYIDSNPAAGTLGTPGAASCEWLSDDIPMLIGQSCTSKVLYTPNPGTSAPQTASPSTSTTPTRFNVATVSLTLRPPSTLHVNTADDVMDENGCDASPRSLREAVYAAQSGDTIDFTLSLPTTIYLANEEPIWVDKDITISGPVPSLLSAAANLARVFWFNNYEQPINASISGLT